MSYKEVKQNYPYHEIEIVEKDKVKNHIQNGFKLVSTCIIDNWGTDPTRCYMVK